MGSRGARKKEAKTDLKEAVYEQSVTVRLTNAWKDYIVGAAEAEGSTLTQVVRDALLAHREARKEHVDSKQQSS
jgi:uncharacterized protein (DUF1778 family)